MKNYELVIIKFISYYKISIKKDKIIFKNFLKIILFFWILKKYNKYMNFNNFRILKKYKKFVLLKSPKCYKVGKILLKYCYYKYFFILKNKKNKINILNNYFLFFKYYIYLFQFFDTNYILNNKLTYKTKIKYIICVYYNFNIFFYIL